MLDVRILFNQLSPALLFKFTKNSLKSDAICWLKCLKLENVVGVFYIASYQCQSTILLYFITQK